MSFRAKKKVSFTSGVTAKAMTMPGANINDMFLKKHDKDNKDLPTKPATSRQPPPVGTFFGVFRLLLLFRFALLCFGLVWFFGRSCTWPLLWPTNEEELLRGGGVETFCATNPLGSAPCPGSGSGPAPGPGPFPVFQIANAQHQ